MKTQQFVVEGNHILINTSYVICKLLNIYSVSANSLKILHSGPLNKTFVTVAITQQDNQSFLTALVTVCDLLQLTSICYMTHPVPHSSRECEPVRLL